MAQQQMTSSQKALMLELKSLQEEPVEGFRITLVDESDLYNWEVAIFGPPNTLYEGGYFKVPPAPLQPGFLGRRPPLSALFPAKSGSAGERRGLLTSAAPSPIRGGRKASLALQVPFLCHGGGGGGGRPDCTGK